MFKLPSRVQELHFPFINKKGIRLFIKRDDEIHDLVSGNKWRKLKPILERASIEGIEKIQSIGGPYSNHLLALAVACKTFGFDSEALIRGEEIENPVLNICLAYGMKLKFISREEFSNFRKHSGELKIEGKKMFIPEGASCIEGEEGMKTLVDELEKEYTDIIDCVGSGTSVRGLKKSLTHGISLHAIMCVKDQELAKTLTKEGIQVHSGFERRGFAKIDKALMESCADFQENTNILLDPVYTAKMWMAVEELIRRNYFKQGSKILMIHSGGLQGWLGDGMMEALNKVRGQ